MFAGNTMLLPKSMTATPEAFNKGFTQRTRSVGRAVHHHHRRPHRAANRVDPQPEMVGNPRRCWTAITYIVLDDAARIPALQNNAIDATGTATRSTN